MKKFIICLLTIIIIFCIYNSTFATEDTETNIPVMKFDDMILMMKSRQAKVDIIKKNNMEIEGLKIQLKENIVAAAEKINTLKISVSQNKVDISDSDLQEFKDLLEFLQESKNTLEGDVEKISNEINSILDLISTKGMQLAQYDKLISKQNEVIVKMKSLLTTMNKI